MATNYHDRRLAARLKDPEFRAEYERASRETRAGARHNDEVVARLLYGPKTRQKGLTFELLDGVVTGMRTIELNVI